MQPSDDLVKLLATTFISRRDVKAVQSSTGAYHPSHEKWSMKDLRDHIMGERSLGHYMVNKEGKTNLFAFDIDLDQYGTWEDGPLCDRPECDKPHIPKHNIHPREVWKRKVEPVLGLSDSIDLRGVYRKQFRAIGEGLASRITRIFNIKAAIAYSGNKGIHVYGFSGEDDANDVREAALRLLSDHTYTAVRGDVFWKHETEFPHMTIEIFPKQDSVRTGDGLGNLMRLPLGRNLKGGRAFFLDPTAPEGDFVEQDALTVLQEGCFLKTDRRRG
jgi:hypothetical protein